MISKKHYDFNFFFGFLKHFFRFRKYFGIVPYRLPYNSVRYTGSNMKMSNNPTKYEVPD